MVDEAIRHVQLRQGILGIKVKIMLPPTQQRRLPDMVTILDPKEEEDLEPAVISNEI